MPIFGDIKEYKEAWKTAPVFLKGLIIVMFFLSVSSITSLADEVFKWRGFIRDGIDFYHNTLTVPIIDFLKRYNIVFYKIGIDMITLILLFHSAGLRAIYVAFKKGRDFDLFSKVIFSVLVLYTLYQTGETIMVWHNSGENLENKAFEEIKSVSLYLFMMLALFSIACIILIPRVENRKAVLISLWVPVLIPVLIVLVLAAINSGLTKELPPI
ncbi:hypothetical protein [Roseivirga misakiensis]|uniref:Yip1 domain-containing protein n=1 Tax=Roseivirga misakiensis TaxID=1563681 RepID=A0A1E5T4R1_9BACT|nr:hypothetical protein [Roseivirga misakiensis]OEK06359.1 hypothetical protein BFP71_01390 [Roseivirga misakiensis]